MKKYLPLLRWNKSRCKHKGFTLIECVVVIFLLGCIAVLMVGNTSFLHRWVLDAELERLYFVCRYLQHTAMIEQKEQVLYFDTHDHRYSYHGTTHPLPSNISFGIQKGIKGPPSSPVKEIKKPITFVNNRITFYPDGIIQSGTIYMITNDYSSFCAISCPISKNSYIRRYWYDTRWHIIS